jgi:hypothetical protein
MDGRHRYTFMYGLTGRFVEITTEPKSVGWIWDCGRTKPRPLYRPECARILREARNAGKHTSVVRWN